MLVLTCGIDSHLFPFHYYQLEFSLSFDIYYV